jgi:hypothetical protein
MPVQDYGVVIGALDHFERDDPNAFGQFFHGHISVRTPNPQGSGTIIYNCAVDVNAPTGAIEFLDMPVLDAAKFIVVPTLSDGYHRLASTPMSGALDYARSPLLQQAQGCMSAIFNFLAAITGRPAPPSPWLTNSGTQALDVLERLVLTTSVEKVFVFGSRYLNAAQNPPQGMHDIHCNQGDPPGQFRPLDGIWQDGGVITRSSNGIYGGYFVKFASQSLNTDNNGWPI